MSKESDKPFHIVVVGGGTAGWMAANLIAHGWREKNIRITVIEAPDIGIIGVGEGSTPQLKAFFSHLGIEESAWMPKCNATYKNGISFHGWSEKPDYKGYFHPFAAPLDSHTSPAFFYNSHFRRQGLDLDATPDKFFVSAYLARKRLAPLPSENFPFEMAYGYHFDAFLVGAMLRERATAHGVTHLQAKVTTVNVSERGDIASLTTDAAGKVEGDFFIDSTGFRSLLLQDALGVKFNSFASNLFNDSAVVMPTPCDPTGVNAQTKSTAMKNGWAWDIPLTNRTGNGYVYSSKYCSADEAESELREHLGLLESDVEARHLNMKVGQVEKHWARNCLAVGLSQGFIEPLEATALHLVQSTVEGFMQAFESGGFTNKHESSFNADISARFDGVRDYIVCHYRANLRTDTDYWRDNAANNNLSDRLDRILHCWFSRGDLKRIVAETSADRYYPLTSWICLLGGYGNYPDTAKLRAPNATQARFDVTVIEDFIRRCGMNFRDHRTILDEMSAAR